MKIKVRWWKRQKPEPGHAEVEEARRERELSERRLREAEAEVIIPLRRMHLENHVGWLIDRLIENRVENRGAGRDGNGPVP